MSAPPIAARGGLDGVAVCETSMSKVDGEAGRLIVRGYSIEQLAGATTVEQLAHLLWHGSLPDAAQAQRLRVELGAARRRAFGLLHALGPALGRPGAMNALRAAIAQLPETADNPIDLTASVAVFCAAHWRLRTGHMPLEPATDLDHAADFLRMTLGAHPGDHRAAAMATYLVTIADHGLNASTFTARVISSTRADMISAVTGAIGALKGPLHGGAPGPVLDMLDGIGDAHNAHAWLSAKVRAGERIMGVGHRVYRVRDPRAAVLERALARLRDAEPDRGRLMLAHAVEQAAIEVLDDAYPERRLRANVEFYTAILLEALGLHRDLFSAVFAVGRVVGWCGHILEQERADRLIRPEARYVGPLPPGLEPDGDQAVRR